MERIESFKVNHLDLLPGIYVSRRDHKDGVTVTTYDLRFTAPNREPVVDMPAMHTIEHLGATFLRNHERADDIVYFGPMGCRTGCYLVMFGECEAAAVWPLVVEMVEFIIDYEGEIPGAKPDQCGNYSEQNLPMAQYYMRRYREELENRRFEYPA